PRLQPLKETEDYWPLFQRERSGISRLVAGDNLEVMAALRPDFAGAIRLIYLDPPFFAGVDRSIRGEASGENQCAYPDTWQGDLSVYLQWLYERLQLAHELLAVDGVMYLHLDWHSVHYAKVVMDEIFGPENFQNDICWCYREAINSRKRWNRKHDSILFYSKSSRFAFNYDEVLTPYSKATLQKYRSGDSKGRYRIMGRGIIGSPICSQRDVPAEVEAVHPELTYRHYLGKGTLPVDYWQIDIENQASKTRTGYPTQKPEALLERILRASSNPGDLVADFCCGSGTTLVMAAKLGRHWIGCDASAAAIHCTRKRLLESSIPFSLEVCGEAPAGKFPLADLPLKLERDDSGEPLGIALTEEAAKIVDFWSVEWLDDPTSGTHQPHRPVWWSGRTRRRPETVRRFSGGPAPAGRDTGAAMIAHVQLCTSSGHSLFYSLEVCDLAKARR
ncbi:MAG TPA: DNA methyltransferase, partial [Chthonomonadales bacterium]|nr:DNA methyltransferase [Chthonomonadales bacterium]